MNSIQICLTTFDFRPASRINIEKSMGVLVYLMRGLHNVVGISVPKPEHEKWVALLWVGVAVAMVLLIGGFGYFILNSIATTR